MKTQKIPFSIDKMKDAIRYETRDGREVIQVTVFDCKSEALIAGVYNGGSHVGILDQWLGDGKHLIPGGALDLFIIIEKPIEYPCLCWVSDFAKKPSRGDAQKGDAEINLMVDKNMPCYGSRIWSYSTPLTDEELKELGLARADKCAS